MITHLHIQSIGHKTLWRGIAAGVLGAALALIVWAAGWQETWEMTFWDRRVDWLAQPGPATDQIRLILVDQPSLDWAEEENGLPWPWPRQVFGAIIDFCRQSGVQALAFDVVFTEFSRYGVDDDAALGAAIAAFPNFTASIALNAASESPNHWPSEFPAPALRVVGFEAWLQHEESISTVFQQAELPIPEVAQHADFICDVNQEPDSDGVFRRIRFFSQFDDHLFPTLGLGLYLTTHRDADLRMTPGRLLIGNTSIPIDRRGHGILNYRGPSQTHRAYSAAHILAAEIRRINGEMPTEQDRRMADDLRGKYVLFGYSATGLKDIRTAPVGGVYTGVEINATVLDNLLADDFIAPVPPWITIGLVLLLALLGGILTSWFNKPLHYILIALTCLAIPPGLAVAAYLTGFWLPVAVQFTSVSATIILALIFDYATEGRQRRFIKNAFQQYLSPAVIEQLIQYPEHLKLGGEKRTLSIFFSDIQGFTSISELLNPEALTAFLNDYLSAMTDIIHDEGGTVDKYEGDAIIAFWNAPLNVPDHAVRVVRTALRCQAALAELRPRFRQRVGKDVFMRIGINTGPAVVGNLGSHSRFDYTMLGDAVNLASRLEGVNKQFGTYTMISHSTRILLHQEFAFRELARVAVVGRKEAVTVYEPMFPQEYDARREVLHTFNVGLQHFYQGEFSAAADLFASVSEIDPPAAAYLEKCRLIADAPPESWQGIWVMTSK